MVPLVLGNRFEILNGVDEEEEEVKNLTSSKKEKKMRKRTPDSRRRRRMDLLNQMSEVKKVASSEEEKKKGKRIDFRTDRFNQLPDDAKYLILSKLKVPFEILLRVQYVCSSWRNISKDPRFYSVINERELDYFARYYGRYFCKSDCYSCGYVSEDNYCGSCRRWKCKWIRHAVDLSCGQLTELHIAYCVRDDLLHYIFDRSKSLKRFVLQLGWEVSERGLIEGFRKVPLLEDIDFSCFSYNYLSKDLIAEIGRSCLNLEMFALRGVDDYAFAIAENMPKLRRLRLVTKLSNEGLQAILDGCPYLEDLNISRCYGIKIHEKLREQCEQRLKHFEWNQEELLPDRRRARLGLLSTNLTLMSDDDDDDQVSD